jgi:hypothetical protein
MEWPLKTIWTWTGPHCVSTTEPVTVEVLAPEDVEPEDVEPEDVEPEDVEPDVPDPEEPAPDTTGAGGRAADVANVADVEVWYPKSRTTAESVLRNQSVIRFMGVTT